MQNHFKPQVEVSLSTAFELANLSFSQFERLTGLNIEQAKVSTELANTQLNTLLNIKDPANALETMKLIMEESVLSLAGYATTAIELTQEFHSESAAFADSHFDYAHEVVNNVLAENFKNAPAGSEATVVAVKAAVEAGNKALAEARKNAKLTAELFQENLAKFKEYANTHTPKAAAKKAPARRKARA